jgi:hypothetical protein
MTSPLSTVVDNDQAPSPRFLVVDSRVPAAIRQLLDEAAGCLNMAFTTGGTACARRAVLAILVAEGITTGEYQARLVSLSAKYPAVPPALFQILELLGHGEEPLATSALKALIVSLKMVVYEIHVLGAERLENLMYVTELVKVLDGQAGDGSRRGTPKRTVS